MDKQIFCIDCEFCKKQGNYDSYNCIHKSNRSLVSKKMLNVTCYRMRRESVCCGTEAKLFKQTDSITLK